MATSAFVGKVYFERGDGATPTEVFTRVCQIFSLGGIGQTNALVEATTFCSSGSMEYIGGLADGAEITLEANYERGTNSLKTMITDVTNKRSGNYHIVVGDVGDANIETFAFAALALGWTLNPSVEGRNTISYTVKISGPITITVTP